jgi:diadenosine tetraphosphate (Ap4A) HIT family hydrolase
MTTRFPVIDRLDPEQVRALVYCKGFKQYRTMAEGFRAGKCAFCDPLDPEKNRVIHENPLWRMWVNPFPEQHTSLHLVMASRRHVAAGTNEPLVGADDFAAMGELFSWAMKEFGLVGGGFMMRFGSPSQNAGTVLHAHANIIVPNGLGEVRIPLAKKPEDDEAGIKRLFVYQKIELGLAAGKGVDQIELTDAERTLVEGRL